MKYLSKINSTFEKFMPIITPLSLLAGVLFPQVTKNFVPYVTVLFAFMTFQGSLGSNFRQIADVFRKPLPLITILLMLHIWIPLTARVLGGLLFGFNPNLVAGIVLEYVVPTGVVSMMWVSMYSGSTPLTLSVIITDTVLSPVLIPLSLKAFLGASVSIDTQKMMLDMLFMIALPAVLGMTVNQISKGRANEKLKPTLAPFGKIALVFVISGNSSSVAPFVRHLTPTLICVMLFILCLAASGYLWGWLAAKVTRQKGATLVSMVYNSGMRNISAGAVIAGAYFPPETMFPVMIGTLFQQILAAFYGVLLKKYNARKEQKEVKKEADGNISFSDL